MEDAARETPATGFVASPDTGEVRPGHRNGVGGPRVLAIGQQSGNSASGWLRPPAPSIMLSVNG